MPTSPGAILHHTDPKGPNISGGRVSAEKQLADPLFSSYSVDIFSSYYAKLLELVLNYLFKEMASSK